MNYEFNVVWIVVTDRFPQIKLVTILNFQYRINCEFIVVWIVGTDLQIKLVTILNSNTAYTTNSTWCKFVETGRCPQINLVTIFQFQYRMNFEFNCGMYTYPVTIFFQTEGMIFIKWCNDCEREVANQSIVIVQRWIELSDCAIFASFSYFQLFVHLLLYCSSKVNTELRLIPVLSVLVAYVYILCHDAWTAARCYTSDASVDMKQPHFEKYNERKDSWNLYHYY